MNGIFIYVLLGGIFFIAIFLILSYVVKKLKKYFGKKYLPETATSFKCIDDHTVRSKGELIIDNYLYNHGILHEYEKKFKVHGKPILCDWFLPEFDIFIEHWGFYGKEYMKRKEEKIKLYNKGNLNLISIEDVMFQDINKNLNRLLTKFINLNESVKHCPNCGWAFDERF